MREYSIPLSDIFRAGLRKETTVPRNSQILTQCKYMKPYVNGLISAAGVSDPFGSTQFDTWPFPQLIRGMDVTLLAGSTTLELVDESDWSLTSIDILNYSDEYSSDSIISGGVWHFIDLQTVWILLNGECMVFKPGFPVPWSETTNVFTQSDISIKTGCEFMGRVLLGGFDPDNFTTVDWNSIKSYWSEKLPYAIDDILAIGGTNYIWWSTIGGGDVFQMLYPDKSITGLILEDESATIEDPLFMDTLKRNERGLMPMPWKGTVLNTKPLGKGAMVYGDNGMAYVFPAVDPISTVGVKKVMSVGIADRGAVGGDDQLHLIVDTEGALWFVDEGLKPTRLGYVEYFSPMLGGNIVITYDRQRKWFYIGGYINAVYYSYVLTEQGLGECNQIVTSGMAIDSAFVGIYDTQGDTISYIVSDVIDFGNRDIKTITTVEIVMEVDEDTNVYIAVDSRMNSSSAWVRSTFKRFNPAGWMRVEQAGIEFRIVVKASTHIDTRLDSMSIHYQQTSNKTIRGIGVNATNTL